MPNCPRGSPAVMWYVTALCGAASASVAVTTRMIVPGAKENNQNVVFIYPNVFKLIASAVRFTAARWH